MSDYEFLKPWGGEVNFMLSYGIKPDPDGFEEARELCGRLAGRGRVVSVD